jgi:hypothetical protein
VGTGDILRVLDADWKLACRSLYRSDLVVISQFENVDSESRQKLEERKMSQSL